MRRERRSPTGSGLTRTGVSCGCLALPDVFETGNVFRIGRDGSLLTQHWLAGASRGVFEVYPGLFR